MPRRPTRRISRRHSAAPVRLLLFSCIALLPFLFLIAPDTGNARIAAPSVGVMAQPRLAARSTAAHTISYDRYSLLVDGHRLVLFGGEFQFWRTPSPEQWPFILREMRAAGLNAVSVGVSWQYHSPAPGVYDFSGIRDLGRFLDDAAAAGLYVIARPGPAYDSESNASNLPGWLLARTAHLRANGGHAYCGSGVYSHDYAAAYTDWYRHVLPIIAARQFTQGRGTVVALQIENEYSPLCGDTRYMRELHDLARQEGIDVPLIANNNACCVPPGSWSIPGDDGQPIVDIPAEDDYPCVSTCPQQWDSRIFSTIDTLESRLRHSGATGVPLALAELQNGYFTGWGGQSYSQMERSLGSDFTEMLDGSVLGQGATLVSLYMAAGGTSWGYLGGPNTATSYDYNAAIHEWGTPGPNYDAVKRTAMFVDAFGDMLGATRRSSAISASHPTLLYAVRETVDGPQRGAQVIVLRNADPAHGDETRLRISIDGHSSVIPRMGRGIQLRPHGIALLIARYHLGPFLLDYSTSRPLTQATINGDDVAVFYGTPGTEGETAFSFAHRPTIVRADPGIAVRYDSHHHQLLLHYRHEERARYVVLAQGGRRLVLVLTGPQGAARTWRAATAAGPALLLGPRMVLAPTDDDRALRLETTASGVTHLMVWGPTALQNRLSEVSAQALPRIRAGGISLHSPSGLQHALSQAHAETALHAVAATLPEDTPRLALPDLTRWHFKRESPETATSFEDHAWVRAAETRTTNPNVPASDTLLADDYGFHYGFVWYRGTFRGTGAEQAVRIYARNSYSVWLNGAYLGSSTRHNDLKNIDDQGVLDARAPANDTYADELTFRFKKGLVRPGKTNVIAVLTESLGHNIGFANGELSRSPMGLLSASLVGAGRDEPIDWRLQGAAGGENGYRLQHDGIDSPLNASGLYGERHGWYTRPFDDTSWQQVTVPDTWSQRGLHLQGVGWYRTTFDLHLPPGVTVPLGLTIPHAQDKVVIWLNGLLIGRYWEGLSPQHTFYLPAGVLNEHGRNTLALAVWNRGHNGGLTGGVVLRAYDIARDVTIPIAAP